MAGKIHDEQLKLDIIVNGNDAQKKLGNLQQAKRDLKRENDNLRKAKAQLVAEGKKETEEYKRLTAQISTNNQKLKQNQSEHKQLVKEIGVAGLTTKQLRAEQKRLNAELGNFTKGSEQYNKLALELGAIEKQMRDVRKETNAIKQTLDDDQAFSTFGEAFAKIKDGVNSGDLSALKKGFKGLGSGIKVAAKSALAFIATPLGATIAGLAAVIGVGKMWYKYNVEIAKTIKLTEQLTGLQGQQLSDHRAQVQAVADTFEQDYNEVLRASNALAKQMGISQTDALKLVEQGFVRGANANGDFLDKVREYPVQFKNAGYSAQQFIDVATQEVKGGIYNDKLIETIKEIDLSLREMDNAQIEVLETNFGKKYAKELIDGIAKGEITTKQAFENIIKKSNEMGLNIQQQQKIVADIMKSAGEDTGGYLTVVTQLNEAFDENNKTLNENEQATQRLVQSNKDFEKELANLFDASKSGFPAMLTNLKAIGKEIFTNVLRGFKQWFTSVEQLKQQAGLEGQSKAVKEISENMKLFGSTAAEEVDHQLKAAEKNINRIKKQLDGVGLLGSIFGSKTAHQENLAEAQAYYDELLKIKKGASTKFNEFQKQDGFKKNKTPAFDKGKLTPKKGIKNSLKNLIQKQKEFQEQILLSSKTLIQQEQIAYEKRLKQAGVYGKNSMDLTKKELEVKNILETQHQAKIAKLELNATNKHISNLTKKYQSAKSSRQKDFNNQLSDVTSLAKAKELLKDDLSAEELEKIDTLAQAKKELRNKHNQDELSHNAVFLQSLIKLYTDALNSGEIEGVTLADKILTEDQKEALKEKLDEVKLKLSEITTEKNNLSGSSEDSPLAGLDDVDILGSSPEQWETVFGNLETTAEKIGALSTVLQGLQEAWGMYNKFVTNAENKQLKELERSNKAKKNSFKKQLDDGIISKETYNSKIEKLDNDLAKKKSEIEYKQAKRERTSALFNIAANTALGIMKAVSSFPITGGMPWAGIIAAIGAVQAGLVLSAPMPIPGFEDGLYPVTRTDGKKFNAKLGSTKTGLVSQPTLMDGKYLAGERSTARNPEMIIDDVTFSKLDPKVISYILNVHNGTVSGFEKGKYTSSTTNETVDFNESDNTLAATFSDTQVIDLLTRIANATEKGTVLVFGYEEAEKVKALLKDLDNSKDNGTFK